MSHSVRSRLLLFLLTVSIVPIVLMGAIVGNNSYKSLENQSLVFQRELTARVSNEILVFILEREQELFFYRDLIATRPDIENRQSLLANLFSGKRNNYQDVSLLTAEGREVAFVSRSAIHSREGNNNLSAEAYFSYPASRKQTYFGPIYFDEELREPLLRISVPMIDLRTGNLSNVLAATIRIKKMWSLLASLDLPEGMEIFVVNADKKIVAHRNPSLALKLESYQSSLQEGRISGQGGNEAFATFKSIRFGDNRLDIVSEHELSLALKTANHHIKTTAIITLVVLLLVTIATLRVAKIVLEPISSLTDAAAKIQRGEYFEITANSGLREMDALSGTFNHMSQKLQQTINELKESERKAVDSAEQLAAAKENLEKQVQARTSELADSVDQLQREAEERVRLSAKLENQNAELEGFAYTVSHDLKSPLMTIGVFVELLRRDITNQRAERIDSDLDKISEATDTMNLLLDDLLELSRAGRIIGELSDCGLSDIARQATEALAGIIDERGIELEIDDMPSVRVDVTRLREVYQNLIENAVKYMGEQKTPRIRIGAEVKDDMVYCFVSDNGIGIELKFQKQIFDLFHRLSNDISGTGVGLALVKRIVEVHGGKVWVESEGLGKGTSLWFALPCSV